MALTSEPLLFLGREDEAIAVLERAIDINPITPGWNYKSMAFAHWAAGRCDEAVEWIKASKEDPFFLFLSHPMPHGPVAASGRFRGKSAGGLYGDAVETIDWCEGMRGLYPSAGVN